MYVIICIFVNYVHVIMYLLAATPPMTAPTITGTTPLNSTSFTVSWTITDPNHNYIITWTNLRTGMMEGSMTVLENTNSYTVTRLNGIDNYNVSVTANNLCGMMMSDPITAYGKDQYNHLSPSHLTSHTYVLNYVQEHLFR